MLSSTTKLRLVQALGDQHAADELELRLFPSSLATQAAVQAYLATLDLKSYTVLDLHRRVFDTLAGGSGSWTNQPGDKALKKIEGALAVLQIAALDVAAVAAHYTGTPTGCSTPVTITANTAGTAGDITLTGNGTSTIAALISAWNTANPSNQITLTSGSGTQEPSNGASIALTGGAAGSGPSLTPALAAMGSDHMDADQLNSWTIALGDAGAAAELQAAYNAMIDTVQAL